MQATTTVMERRVPVRRTVAAWLLLTVQFYVASTYAVTTIAQYALFRDDDPWLVAALSPDGAANPLAVLFIVPGYYITLLSGPVFAVAALWGGAAAASRWAYLSARSRAWSASGVAVCAALFVFGLTPLGRDMAVWIAG